MVHLSVQLSVLRNHLNSDAISDPIHSDLVLLGSASGDSSLSGLSGVIVSAIDGDPVGMPQSGAELLPEIGRAECPSTPRQCSPNGTVPFSSCRSSDS